MDRSPDRAFWHLGDCGWGDFYLILKILVFWSKFWGILWILVKLLRKTGLQKFQKTSSFRICPKLPARFLSEKPILLQNCQKCQKRHFDRETFLAIFFQNFQFFKILLQFSNPKPYGFFIFKQILNPKPPNCSNFPKFSFFHQKKLSNFSQFSLPKPQISTNFSSKIPAKFFPTQFCG